MDKEQQRQYNAQYYRTNSERIRQHETERYRNDPGVFRQKNAQYYQNNIEVIKQRTARYRQEHAESCQLQNAQRRHAIKLNVLTHYGLQCTYCPESRPGALQLDHILGGGRQRRRQPGGHCIYTYIGQQYTEMGVYPTGYQTLCANCNLRKHITGLQVSESPTAVKQRHYRWNLKRQFMDQLGSKCYDCGCADLVVLTAEHVYNNGAEHRREISNGLTGGSFYRAVLRSGDFTGLICLCASCNCNRAYQIMPAISKQQLEAAVTQLLQEELQDDPDYYAYNGDILKSKQASLQLVACFHRRDDKLILVFTHPRRTQEFLLADPDCFAQAARAIRAQSDR